MKGYLVSPDEIGGRSPTWVHFGDVVLATFRRSGDIDDARFNLKNMGTFGTEEPAVKQECDQDHTYSIELLHQVDMGLGY